MKILFLTPQLPYPPRQGTALRNYHLVEALAGRHDVSLLSFLEPDQPADPAKWGPLPELCQGIVPVPIPPRSYARRLRELLLTRQPDMALRLWSDAFADQLADWLKAEPFDVVQIEGIELATYLPFVERIAPRSLVVFDDHNAEYVLQQRAFETDFRLPKRWHAAAYSFLQWRRLRRFEAATCRKADQVIAVSGTDRAALERLVPGLKVEVIPNCIDTAAYRSIEPGPRVPAFTVLFTGKMDFRPNVDAALWFGRDIWPLVREGHPEATWGIVGKAPHPRLDVLRDDPSIALVGEVAEIPPYLAAADLYVIPLRMGGGTRFKLLEAMAAGTPVVSTTVGAEGVPVRSGRELLVADSVAEFAAAVLRLLHDPALGRQLSTAARKLVIERFDWRVVLGDLEHIYRL
jgi:glycosyltransferase involved in cell wall biosynthesis